MSKEIVFDIETQDVFSAERKSPADLHLSVVVIYRYETETYEYFLEKDLAKLWPILEHSNRLIGYNINHFDLPVLARYYPGGFSRFPVLDMLEVVRNSIDRRLKLDSLASATLGYGKNGDGLQAVKLFAEGKIAELVDYCSNDVKITKELYEYGLKNQQLFFEDFITKNKMRVPVDFSIKEKKGTINLSLGL